MVVHIDGKKIANEIIETIRERVEFLVSQTSITPGLGVIIVGKDEASQIYVAAKSKKAKECGFHSLEHTLEENASEEELVSLIKKLNIDPQIHGILVQLPLPLHMNSVRVTQSVSALKDVDGFNFLNIGKLCFGHQETFVPCTPAGAMILIKRIRGSDLTGLHAVIIGRSNIVGKPMANLLLSENCTVTITHSRTKNLDNICQEADILVAAVGKSKMVKGDWIKKGATLIDVGINRVWGEDKKSSMLTGDIDYEGALKRAGAITPVPGGVGPMTIAMLMANTLTAAYRVAGLKFELF